MCAALLWKSGVPRLSSTGKPFWFKLMLQLFFPGREIIVDKSPPKRTSEIEGLRNK